MKNTIDVILRTTSPWHVAYPENASKKDNGMSVSLTQSKKVAGKAVPCFLANGLRGRLRRIIADRVIDTIAKSEAPISPEVYIGLQTGSSSAQPDSSPNSVSELLRSQANVYMGLFGGGARTLKSRYIVSDINPIVEHTASAGMLGLDDEIIMPILESQMMNVNGEAKHLQPFQLLELRNFTKVDDIARGHKLDHVIASVENAEQGVADYIERSTVSDKARKADDSKATKKTTVANMLGVECISTGVKMHFRVTLDPNLTSAQIGALLIGLQGLFNSNYLGGWGRVGMGQYEVLSMALNIDSYEIKEVLENNLYSNGEFSYQNASNEVNGFVSDANDAISSVSRDEMVGYFTNITAAKGKK